MNELTRLQALPQSTRPDTTGRVRAAGTGARDGAPSAGSADTVTLQSVQHAGVAGDVVVAGARPGAQAPALPVAPSPPIDTPPTRISLDLPAADPPAAGRSLVDRFVSDYGAATGFPDLRAVSARMREHAATCLRDAGAEVGVEVLCASYDPHCSVGRGDAMPGSDFDGMLVLVRSADRQQKQHLLEAYNRRLNPTLVQPENPDDFRGKWPQVCDSRVMTMADWDQYKDKPLIHDEQSLDDPQAQRHFRMANLAVSVAQGAELLRSSSFADRIEATPLATHSDLGVDDGALPPKVKSLARKMLCAQFDSLPDAEKLVMVQILQAPDGNRSPMTFLADRPDNDLRPVLESLAGKGLLVRFDPSVPRSTKDDALQYLRPFKDRLDPVVQMGPRYIAPFKPSHADEPILSWLFEHKRLLEHEDVPRQRLPGWWNGFS